MQPNPSPTTEQREGASIIEELRAAGEELKRAEQEEASTPKDPESEEGDAPSVQGSGQATLEVDGSESKHQEGRPLTGSKKAEAAKASSGPSSISVVEGKKGWVSLEDHQKAIASEKERMREAYTKIEELGRKVREKLEALEKMEGQTEKINKALKELGQRIVSVKKENDTLLYQIKEKLTAERSP